MSIDHTKHQDTRRNNPAMASRKFFVREEEKSYEVRYPRDPTLDPQLPWRGKDERDRQGLAVPTDVPEKAPPAQIVADLKRRGGSPLIPLPRRREGDRHPCPTTSTGWRRRTNWTSSRRAPGSTGTGRTG